MEVGRYIAVGDYAQAMLAVGKTEAHGSVYTHIGKLASADTEYIYAWLHTNVPTHLAWAKEIYLFLLRGFK